MTALNRKDLINIQRELSKRSMAEFLRMAWPCLDPGQQYLHNWHMDVMGEHLQAVAEGQINRLLFNVPPGTSKSSAVGVYFPAWLWGPGEKQHFRFIGAAHEQTLATRDNRKTRLLVESDWYQNRWHVPITSDQNEKTYFENEMRGFRQASAVKSMTGKRGHVVAWDDPINPENANSPTHRETALRVFSETLPNRLVDPILSAIVIVMQRLHQNDVSGHILESDLGYEHVMLPMEFEPGRRCYTSVKPKWRKAKPVLARYNSQKQRWVLDGEHIDPDEHGELMQKPLRRVYPQDHREEDGELLFVDRFPREVVDRDKKVMGTYATAGQYQQRPSPRGGGMFKRTDFKIVDAAPPGCRWVRGWDLAASEEKESAFTAGVLIGEAPDGVFYIKNVVRDQLTSSGVEKLIENTASQDGHDVRGSVPQDPGAGGKAWAISLIKAAKGYSYRATPENGDKVTRAEPLSAQVEINNVHLVRGAWNKAFLDEAEVFPAGKFKDQVDAASRAFMELNTVSEFEWYVGGETHK